MKTKICTKCGVAKPATAEFFHRHNSTADNLRPHCKMCRKTERRDYHAENKERANQVAAEWYQNNKAKHLANGQKWREDNPEKARALGRRAYRRAVEKDPDFNKKQNQKYAEQKRRWREENAERSSRVSRNWYQNNKAQKARVQKLWRERNRDKVRSYDAKRRGVELRCTPPWLTKDQQNQIQDTYALAQAFSVLFEEPYEVDHIIPLQGESVSGLHVPWNLQVLTRTANRSKGNTA